MAKGLTADQLRSSSPEELSSKLAEAKEELFNLRFQGATGQLESHGRLRGLVALAGCRLGWCGAHCSTLPSTSAGVSSSTSVMMPSSRSRITV